MKKTVELLNKINNLKNEMTVLNDNGEVDKALEKVTEIENLKKEFKIAQIAEEELVNKVPDEPIVNKKSLTDPAPNLTQVFNKAIRGLTLTDVENAMIEQPGDSNGGEYLVPVEQIQRINEIKKTLIPLKNKCEVIPVKSPKGNMPTNTPTDDCLMTTQELAETSPSDIKFNLIEYATADYSDLILISNQLFADSAYDVTGIINQAFARKAVNTENKQIITNLDKCTSLAGTTVKVINKALNVELDPALKTIAEILTDQDGYNYLDSLEDKIGRPLLTDSISQPGAKEYYGKPITTMRNGFITKPANSFVFYVGSVQEALAFFDREEIVISMSNDFVFNKRAKAFLAEERFDVKIKNTSGVIKVTITPKTGTTTPTA
ncbi:MAG: phage major capsid protein [Sarcina sp.]